jgi:NUMOD4 motif
MSEEVWKPIDGTNGLYEISSHGRVRSLDREVGHRIRPPEKARLGTRAVTRRHGEMLEPDKHFVKLTLAGRSRQVRPARLVQQHFPKASAERRIGLLDEGDDR